MRDNGTEQEADLSDLLDQATDDAKAYWEAQRDYTQLVASERAGKIGSSMMAGIVLLSIASIVLILLSFAAAYWIGELTGSLALGFLYVSLSYLGLLLIFYVLWRSFLKQKVFLGIVNAINGQ